MRSLNQLYVTFICLMLILIFILVVTFIFLLTIFVLFVLVFLLYSEADRQLNLMTKDSHDTLLLEARDADLE